MRVSIVLFAKTKPSYSLSGSHLIPPPPPPRRPRVKLTQPLPAHRRKPLLKRVIDNYAPTYRFAGDVVSLPLPPSQAAAVDLRLLGPSLNRNNVNSTSNSNSPPSFSSVRGVQGPLVPIIYEDKHYAFIAKPAGQGLKETTIFSHRIRTHARAQKWSWGKLMFKLTPGASGIITFAKHRFGKSQVGTKRIRERMRTKRNTPWAKWLKNRPHEFNNYLRMEYVALVHGQPELPRSSEITPILKAAITKKHQDFLNVEWSNVLPDLVCRFTVIASVPHKTLGYISALSITLHKGHADVIRAACAQLLHTPILGDTLYGGTSMEWVSPFVDPADLRDEGLWGARLPPPRPPPSMPLFLPSDSWPKLVASGLAPPSLLTPEFVPSLALSSSQTLSIETMSSPPLSISASSTSLEPSSSSSSSLSNSSSSTPSASSSTSLEPSSSSSSSINSSSFINSSSSPVDSSSFSSSSLDSSAVEHFSDSLSSASSLSSFESSLGPSSSLSLTSVPSSSTDSLAVLKEQEDAVAHLVVPLDSMGRFMASYFDEDDDDYYVEFEAEEDKFVAERAYQSALKTEQYHFKSEQDRAAYDTDDDQPQAVEEDSAPFLLHRSRMRFCPRPDSGNVYDVTAAPPWKFLLHLPKKEASLMNNPLSDDLPALETIVRATFKYCDDDQSDSDTQES